ncbi:cryptochrome [Teratosphaeria nubilosa]|uniref:Cryptochrome DASH n=1 Tax=Teratosphaeria nubilosa TaxID=161662 RepID=A0A6G1LL55_9PEZI|nr:cryptochrome [Teratosphaeria nubilosa]
MSRVLIYLIRRDLRLADNPIFHELAKVQKQSPKPFTHVLPVFIYSAEQVEVSGFLTAGHKSPYPEARSKVSGLWRCGRLRAKFTAESVWDLKKDLESIGSRLEVRVGSIKDIVRSLLDGYKARDDAEVHGLWMTGEEPWEEVKEENEAREVIEKEGKEFKLWVDEKYFVDDRDLPFDDAKDLSDVFTTFRKTVEPLREAPRKQLPRPERILPSPDFIPPQAEPFAIPDSLEGLTQALYKPIAVDMEIPHMHDMPEHVESAHPFIGGSKPGHERIHHLIESGAMSAYKDTRNGLLGLDFSTKLSAWLALGCLTARQIHWYLIDFEDAKTDLGKHAAGYGKGENKGTAAVRFELLWRDYMRLCTRKFGLRLFYSGGYRHDHDAKKRMISNPYTASTEKKNKKGVNDADTKATVERFFRGETGTGLIDASQRELFLTGWTSNRARQNVASYLTKHLGLDWRIGAEWYEANLIDYDASSNWGNWQYVAGVGNDPRGDARVFNPVKQAVDYDSNGEYVKAWVPELRGVSGEGKEALMGVFQAWRLAPEEKRRLGLEGVEWVERPLVRIQFEVNRRGGERASSCQSLCALPNHRYAAADQQMLALFGQNDFMYSPKRPR